MTSFDVIAILRKTLKIRKIGHTGTLDPDATGVLPVCIGKATKLVSLLEDTNKTYRAVMLIGRRTDTQDISGETVEEISQDDCLKILAISGLSPADSLMALQKKAEKVMASFVGEIEQVPPMYSALKVNGVKLVDAARKGKVIERKPRSVTIYSIRDIRVGEDLLHISFEAAVSKGTYIRTLCEDIGKALGVPACLAELERTEASGLSKETALTLNEVAALAEKEELDERIIPVDQFLSKYPPVVVNEDGKRKLLVGNFLSAEDLLSGEFFDGIFRVYDREGMFFALYRYDADKNCLRPEKMFL